jgi:protein Tex
MEPDFNWKHPGKRSLMEKSPHDYMSILARELSVPAKGIQSAVTLLDQGDSIPFIARYRKEVTGNLDEVLLTAIRDRITQLRDLDTRRESILKSLIERELLTEELQAAIMNASTMTELEDTYLPYRPKRRTRAAIAREKGLEPLAAAIFKQEPGMDPVVLAVDFVDSEKGVESVDDALAGARDILAEWINEDAKIRAEIRKLYAETGCFRSRVIKGKEEEGAKYRDYFDWVEPVNFAPSHRVLAIRRGEKEGYLNLRVEVTPETACDLISSRIITGNNPCANEVRAAIDDCFKRLLSPSMETEIRMETKNRADSEAIKVFAENVRQLLLSAPLGRKRVMAIDPGFRTGCKIVCLNSQGRLEHFTAIYPHTGDKGRGEAETMVRALADRYRIEAIAIGNGTAGRETEAFIRELKLPGSISVIMVNESGASIYSASDVAREEFPDQDVTVRGAVSIGRRLMDPLAELVKIDPKSIGVGQYQHDVDQKALKQSLDDTVMSCVNSVGVDLNTASKQLLSYVSGLGPQLAGNIVVYRNENGAFTSRTQLKKVPRLGPKAFEQAAGFLRITGGKNPLDGSAVHPESYSIVRQMASDLACSVVDLMKDESIRKKIELKTYLTGTVGMPTLTDILVELARPGRDPRESFEIFEFSKDVNAIEDLKPGMKLPGLVTNITRFGAFVDIGVHQDGLVHISQLADRFVKDPADEVSVNQAVEVTVLEVDILRKRISLSMRK